MSNWVDRIWSQTPGTPTIGSRTALTKEEKRILLAYAGGADNNTAFKEANILEGTLKGVYLPRLRAKLHASSAPRMVKCGYEVGALELEYSGEPPKGVAELMPEGLVAMWRLIADGLSNVEIGERLHMSDGQVRARVLALGQGLSVAPRMGGRTQISSRAFEFNVIEGAHWVQRKEGKGK